MICQRKWPRSRCSPALVTAFLSAALPKHRESGPFRFLNVAFLHPKKGHADLLGAFSERFGGDVGVQLRIGGSGEERDALHAKASALCVADQVVWLGALSREDVLAEMLAADAFVLSSRIETFGVVVIEALACGLPVVATRSGGPECIVGEADGELVQVGDVAGLGQAMVDVRAKVVAGAFDRDELRARCAERFSEDALVSRLSEVYVRATGGVA